MRALEVRGLLRFAVHLGNHLKPGCKQVLQRPLLLQLPQRQHRVVEDRVRHHLHTEILQGALLRDAQPPQSQLHVGPDLAVHPAPAVLQHDLHQLAGGDHLALHYVSAAKHLAHHVEHRDDIVGVGQKRLRIAVHKVVQRNQDVVKVVHRPLDEALVQQRPERPHAGRDGGREVGEVRQDLHHLLKHLLPIRAQHLVHHRVEDLLQLWVEVPHGGHGL
mmetsp:Transcript_3302/g.8378  ORF Transcript_3302/g.8378 Transcript_3302/m.8378 type:complete len:218 (+) Transcript_3302:259-912(+)